MPEKRAANRGSGVSMPQFPDLNRTWWIVVLCVALGIAGGFAATYLPARTPVYQATTMLLVENPAAFVTPANSGVPVSSIDQIDPETHIALIRSHAVRLRAATILLPEGTPAERASEASELSSVSVQANSPISPILRLTARAPTPDLAKARADAMAQAYIAYTIDERRASMARALELVQEQVAAIAARDGGAQTDDGLYEALVRAQRVIELSHGMADVARIRVVDAAATPRAPVPPDVVEHTVGGALLGLLGGLGFGYLWTISRPVVRSSSDVWKLIEDVPLGTVPQFPRSVLRGGRLAWKLHGAADAYRLLRTPLLMEPFERPRILLVTSPGPQEGKTTTASNLAAVSAQQGLKVLLVDTDLRRPKVHEAFGLHPQAGFVEALADPANAAAYIFPIRDTPGLSVLPAVRLHDPTRVPDVLRPEPLQRLLAELGKHFDVIIVDAPPVLGFADVQLVAPFVHDTLLVVRPGFTPAGALVDAMDHLRGVLKRKPFLVLNRMAKSRPHGHYRYSYGYGYGSYGYRMAASAKGSPRGILAGSKSVPSPSPASPREPRTPVPEGLPPAPREAPPVAILEAPPVPVLEEAPVVVPGRSPPTATPTWSSAPAPWPTPPTIPAPAAERPARGPDGRRRAPPPEPAAAPVAPVAPVASLVEFRVERRRR